MLKGINIDITNNPPDPATLRRLGADAVRFPSRPTIDDGYIDELHRQHIFTLAVVDKPSGGYICGRGMCSMYQIHNEVDGSGPASGSLTIAQCNEELRIYAETYPGLVLVAPGLVAGDYTATYLKGIIVALRRYKYAAIALHPYAKTSSQAVQLLGAHRAVDQAFPIMFTECHPDATDVRLFYRGARDAGCAGVFYHCWNDNMTLGAEGLRLGLVTEGGSYKRELGLWALS